MNKSTGQAEVFGVNLTKHENADSLSIAEVFGGYTTVLKTEDWKDTKKAVFIPPDNLADTTRPEFAFFANEKRLYEVNGRKVYYRIKAKKIRGVVSYGFCVPVPDDTEIGENWFDKLGLIHFDEDEHSGQKGVTMGGGEVESPPGCYFVKYDVDSLRRYKEVFVAGEPCYITCKLHGANFRAVLHNNQMYCGSRSEWKREYANPPNYETIEYNLRTKLVDKISEEEITNKLIEIKSKIDKWNPSQSIWWKALRKNPEIIKFCEEHPDVVVYGELVGIQKGFDYGCKNGEVDVYLFDILVNGKWMDVHDFINTCDKYNMKRVPVIENNYPFNFEKVCEMAEGRSLLGNHIREGVVVKPLLERVHPKVGRVCLKVVGAGYLERA